MDFLTMPGLCQGSLHSRPGLCQGPLHFWPGLCQGPLHSWPGLCQGPLHSWHGVCQGSLHSWPGLCQGTLHSWPGLCEGLYIHGLDCAKALYTQWHSQQNIKICWWHKTLSRLKTPWWGSWITRGPQQASWLGKHLADELQHWQMCCNAHWSQQHLT